MKPKFHRTLLLLLWGSLLLVIWILYYLISPARTSEARETASQSMLIWHIQRVDAPKLFSDMTDRSLRLDSDGRIHIAYGEDFLYYIWYDGQTWHKAIVDDSPGVGRYASLALDAAANPHISYYDVTNGDLKYARWTGINWAILTVDSSGDVGRYTSLALDSAGNPHISYLDYTYNDLKYAYFQDGFWTRTRWVTDGWDGWYTSLALDSN
ncbi:MAG: carboxypeptidase regulatory-like domain-containing protein, partial [Anaerolineae bacterium]|nr:carboxypeptidase regulatory-like domain-containing protein [Anaerolineae bacterium]